MIYFLLFYEYIIIRLFLSTMLLAHAKKHFFSVLIIIFLQSSMHTNTFVYVKKYISISLKENE